MRRKWVLTGVSVWMAGAVLIGSGCLTGQSSIFGKKTRLVLAAKQSEETQKKIDAANIKKQELESEKADLEKDLKEVEKKKSNVLNYIEGLDSKMNDLSEKIADNEEEIEVVQSEIDELEEQEQQVTLKMNSQYETMKTRIKYMYEDGNDGYMDLLLGSSSLSDLYNRMEYITKISDYDQKMFGEYADTKAELEETQNEKQDKMDTLVATQDNLAFEKKSVNSLISKKKQQLSKYNNLIEDSESSISAYNAKIAAQENEVENLLEQQRKQIAAEEQQANSNPGAAGGNSAGGNTGGSDGANSGGSTKVSASGFAWPLAVAGRISCQFGYRNAPTAGASTYHKGIDIATPTGTVVKASKAGKVVTSTYSSSAGYYVAIYHGGGIYTYYMHCSKLCVSVGDKVSRGQKIALSGSTGISTGPHLHFAIYAGGSYVNPLNYVSR